MADEDRWKDWFQSWSHSDRFAHPDSPAGGSGPGYSRPPSPLGLGYSWASSSPIWHPDSPGGPYTVWQMQLPPLPPPSAHAVVLPASTSLAGMGCVQKMEEAINHSKLSEAVLNELGGAKGIAIALAAMAAVWVASQLTPVGWAADILEALAVAGLVLSGREIVSGLKDLYDFWRLACQEAKSKRDLDRAGRLFADALAKIGVNGLQAVLHFKTTRLPDGGPLPPPPEGKVPLPPPNESPKELPPPQDDVPHGPPPKDEVPPVNKAAIQAWKDSLETRSPAGQNMPAARDFQIRNCGDTEYLVKGGGKEVWADGINTGQGLIQDAKYVGDPDRSPFIPDSKIPEKVRNMINRDVEDEFQRYAAVVKDSNTPVSGLEVITNDSRAVPYFQGLMHKYDIPGTVDVKP